MEMPVPSTEHKQLEKLSGIWHGKETMHPGPWSPAPSEAQGTMRARISLSGFALITDYEQSCGGKTTFSGHGVYTWDGQKRQVVLHWFDCMGQGAEEFRGSWKGDRLQLDSKNPMGFARMTYDCSQPGALASRMEVSQDGKTWAPMFDATYKRVPAS
jgi:hypothetical protein